MFACLAWSLLLLLFLLFVAFLKGGKHAYQIDHIYFTNFYEKLLEMIEGLIDR